MEMIRECKTCKKELSDSEVNIKDTPIPADRFYPLPSNEVELYCEKCYNNATGKTFEEELKRGINKNEESPDKN